MNPHLIEPKQFPNAVKIGVTTLDSFADPSAGIPFSVGGNSEIFTTDVVNHFKSKLAEHLQIDPTFLCFQEQVHGRTVRVVREGFTYQESDAMVTNVPEIALCVRLADCGGVVLWDPTNNAVAAIHSGWRGTALNVAVETIDKMRFEYGTKPTELLAFLAPCASGDQYQVGEEVAEKFPRSTRRTSEGKFYFDNRKELILQLTESGVPIDNIEDSGLCTIADYRFHSHRRDGEFAGRNVLFAVIQRTV